MRQSLKTGLSFGLTSGIITTLGLMVGLESGTSSKIAVMGGVLFIAIADAMSDALGIHISEESSNNLSQKEIWESTAATFVTKFFTALMFLIPILLLPLSIAVIVSVSWGIFLIGIFSYFIAKQQEEKPAGVIFEHLLITIIVVTITHYLGNWVATLS